MRSFHSFLFEKVEEKAPKKKKKPAKSKSKIVKDKFGNDERGKLFELGVGFHLNAIAHANRNGLPRNHPDRAIASPLRADGSFDEGSAHLMPSHFRQEGVGPREIHDGIVAGIRAQHGADWRQHYDRTMSHARQTANAIISHAIKHGHLDGRTYRNDKGKEVADLTSANIHDIHWTSQGDKEDAPGDHERLTGTKDTLSAADLIISHGKRGSNRSAYLGVSLKYGSQAKPNYRNPGTEAMSQLAGRKIGKHWEAHRSSMETQLGYTGTADARHEQWKADYEAPEGSKAKKRALAAEASAVRAKNAEAKEFHAGLSNMNSDQLRGMVADLTNPPTVHPHLHVHGFEDEGYHRGFVPKVQEANQKFDIGMSKYRRFFVGKSPEGSTVAIYGEPHPEHVGKVPTRVAELTMKGSSGPHKGLVGTVKADAFTKTKDLSDRTRTREYRDFQRNPRGHQSFASFLAQRRKAKK